MAKIRNINKSKGSKILLPTFMVCDNPMVKSGDYILHTKEPKLLIKVFDLTNLDYNDREKFVSHISIGGSTQMNDNSLYYFSVAEFYSEVKITSETESKLSNLMKRCADWYKALITFEEENY